MKSIFKPDTWKISLTLALLYFSSILWRAYVISRISDTFPLGFPLQFYLAWGPCPPGEVCSEFNWLWLVVDMMIWYVVSAFIISMINKRRSSVEKEMAK
jgi:hypothetical protein